MTQTNRWAEELKDSVEAVRALRDEVKVQLHLASMEAKERFNALEAKLENEQLRAKNSLKEVTEGFREVKKELAKNAQARKQ